MSARRVSSEELERLAWDASAPIEFLADVAFVTVGGREYAADLPAVSS